MKERCLRWIAVGAAAASSGSAGSHLPGFALRNAERGLVQAEFGPEEKQISIHACFLVP